MKRALLLAATIAALALGLSGTASAGTYTCTSSGTYPNANVAIHMSGNPSVVRLKVGANHELLVNDTHCTPLADLRKGPLVAITVASGSDNDGVLLDLSGGPFRDTTHNTDIFFAADLGSGSSDYINVYGSSGTDWLVLGQSGINLNAGEATADYDVLPLNVEAINLSGFGGADKLSLNGGHNTGGSGSYHYMSAGGDAGGDTITGSANDDNLDGGAGDDTINGLGGKDEASYADAPTKVTVDLSAGTSSGGAGVDTLTNIEDVGGSPHDDILAGNNGANLLHGNLGNDFIQGGLGNDSLYGEAGNDWISYYAATGSVFVNLATGTASGADGSDTFTGFEKVLGSPFGDTIIGDSFANTLAGLGGNDSIYGLAGNDILAGGAGDDTENGGTGNDYCQNGPGTDVRTACETP